VHGIVLSRSNGAALLGSDTYPDVISRGAPFGPALLAFAALPEHEESLEYLNNGLRSALGGEWWGALCQRTANDDWLRRSTAGRRSLDLLLQASHGGMALFQ